MDVQCSAYFASFGNVLELLILCVCRKTNLFLIKKDQKTQTNNKKNDDDTKSSIIISKEENTIIKNIILLNYSNV